MKRKIYGIITGLVVLAAGMVTAQETSPLWSRTQDIMWRLEQRFPALATDDTLKHEYEQQLRFQILKGCTYQDVFARFRQELSFQFDGSDQPEASKFRRIEALRNLKTFRNEQDILSGLVGGENLDVNRNFNVVVNGPYSDQKSDTEQR
jgi:hypothetical protein